MAGKSGRARPHAGRTPGMASCAAGPASAATRPRTEPEWPQDDGTPRIASSRRTGFGARPVLPDKPCLPRPEGGVIAGWLSIADAPGGVLDFEPTGSAAAFVPVEFPDLVRHGEGRFEAAERELARSCDQLLAVCPVLVSSTANAGGLAEDLQYTPGGPASGVAGPSGAPAMGMLRIMSAAEPRSSCWRQQPASPVSSFRFAAPGQPSMQPATRRFPGSSTAGAKPRSWPATRSWTSTRPRRCGRSHALARAVLVPVYEA